MPNLTLRPLYVAAVQGWLDSYLENHPGILVPQVAESLEADFTRAVEFGDLDAAALSARVAARIHSMLGNEAASIARHLDLIWVHARSAETPEELRELRVYALSVGSSAQDADLPVMSTECWLIAAAADSRLAQAKGTVPYPASEALGHLSDALRGVADIAESIAECPPGDREDGQVQQLTALLATVSDAAFAVEWPVHDVLGVRALLRRCSRAGERTVPAGIVADMYSDAATVRRVELALTRLFTQTDD